MEHDGRGEFRGSVGGAVGCRDVREVLTGPQTTPPEGRLEFMEKRCHAMEREIGVLHERISALSQYLGLTV
jgi:hypothetical protein